MLYKVFEGVKRPKRECRKLWLVRVEIFITSRLKGLLAGQADFRRIEYCHPKRNGDLIFRDKAIHWLEVSEKYPDLAVCFSSNPNHLLYPSEFTQQPEENRALADGVHTKQFPGQKVQGEAERTAGQAGVQNGGYLCGSFDLIYFRVLVYV